MKHIAAYSLQIMLQSNVDSCRNKDIILFFATFKIYLNLLEDLLETTVWTGSEFQMLSLYKDFILIYV